MPKETTSSIAFEADVSQFTQSINKMKDDIKLINSQFEASASELDDWGKSQDGIKLKIDSLNKVLEDENQKLEAMKKRRDEYSLTLEANRKKLGELDAEYQNVISTEGENSKRAEELIKQRSKLSLAITRNEKSLLNEEIAINKQTTSINNTGKKIKEFEQQKQELNNQSTKTIQQLRDEAKEIGTNAKAYEKNQAVKKKLLAVEKQYEKALQEANGDVKKTAQATKEYQKSLDKLNGELKDTDSSTKAADKATSGFGKNMKSLASSIGGGVAKGITAIAASVTGLAAAFLASAESTREYREDMNKLQTGFQTAGFSAEEATGVYKDFYSILGEEDRSVEAVNHLAKLTSSQEDLQKWTDICAGVWGTFGDSLPIEGLTEAANETAKAGQVTGVLADALVWAGVNEDEFNAKLAAASTEQERAALITDTLNGLYKESSETYKELNKDIIEAREAQANLTDTMARIGEIAEPIVTILKNGLANTLQLLIPYIEQVAEAFKNLLGGDIALGLEQLSTIFMQVKEKAQEMFISILNGITEAIPQIAPKIAEFLSTMVQKFVEFTPILLEAAIQLLMAIVQAIPPTIVALLEQLPLILNSILTALSGMIPMLLEAAINLFTTLVEAIPLVIEKLVEILPQILQAITGFIQENLPVILEAAVTLFMKIVEAIPVLLQSLADALPTIIGAIVDFVVDNLPTILRYAIDLFNQIVAAIPIMIVKLGQQLPTIISKIVSTLLANLPKIATMAFDLFMEIVKAIPKMIIELAKSLPDIITEILDAFKDAPTLLFDIGVDLIEGLWDGISSVGDWLHEKVSGFFGSVEDWAKDILGIHSPSKVFAEIGKYTAEGYEVGFEKEMKNVRNLVNDNMDFGDISAGGVSLGVSGSAARGNNVTLNYTVNSPSSLSRREIYLQAKKMKTMLGGVN